MKKLITFFIVLLPLVFLLSVYLTNFNAPFRSFDEDNGYLFGGVARSHLFLGLRKTLGQDFFFEGMDKEPIPYLHHPPGIGLSLALILRFLNFGNLDQPYWQERLLPTFYTILTYFLLFFLSRHFFKSFKAGLISVLIFVLMPMSLYHGRMVSHEPATLFFLTLTSFLYVKSRNSKNSLLRIGFYVSLFFSCFYGWPGFYFIPVILVLDFVDLKKKRIKINKSFWSLVSYEIILLTIFFGQIYFASQSFFDFISNLVSQKNALPPHYQGGLPYFNTPWLIYLLKKYLSFFTPIIAIPGGIYLIYLAYRRFIREKSWRNFKEWEKISLIFMFISLIHVFVWRTGSFLPYWQIYFLPGLILSVTYVFLEGEKRLKKYLKSGIWTIVYYLIIFTVLVLQSQPLAAYLFTRGGEFPFPHFYITGF